VIDIRGLVREKPKAQRRRRAKHILRQEKIRTSAVVFDAITGELIVPSDRVIG